MSDVRDASIGILLMRCGKWTVGVDALSVQSIRPPRPGEAALDLGVFLQTKSSRPRKDSQLVAGGGGSGRRVIELGGDDDVVSFSIDTALGTRTLGLADVRPLPPVLSCHGAPSWWIGTAEHDGELVLLLDLSALAIATRGAT